MLAQKECVEEAQIDIVETYGECVTVVYALDVLGEAALGDREVLPNATLLPSLTVLQSTAYGMCSTYDSLDI